MANAGLSRKFGRGTLFTLALASNLPDIDGLWSFVGSLWGLPEQFLYRRLFTHSVFGIPVLAAVAAWLLRLRYPNLSWRTLFGLTVLGMGVHSFFDLVNSYGVVLLYPLSLRRFELAWVFIIDLALFSIALAPLLLSCIRSRWADLERLSRLSLAGIALYVGLCGFSRTQAARLLEKQAGLEGLEPEFSYVFPEALGPHRFRGVLKQEGLYRLYLIHAWTGRVEPKGTHRTEEDSPRIRAIRATERAQRLEWFFKAPVWRSVPGSPGEVEVFDLRFQSVVLTWRRTPFVFRFKG